MLDGAAQQLEPGRVEVVASTAGCARAARTRVEARGERLARHQDEVGRPIDHARGPPVARSSAETISTPVLPAIASVSRMLSAPRSEAQTSPTREPFGRPAISWTSSTYARPDEHGHDRDAAGDEGLGLVGVERRRRHEVVVEALEALGQVVEERAFGLDETGEFVDQPLRVVAGVGVGALGEQHADERARAACARWRRRTWRRRARRP